VRETDKAPKGIKEVAKVRRTVRVDSDLSNFLEE